MEDDIIAVLEQEYRNNQDFWERRLQRWARKRWPGMSKPLDCRKVWGYLLAAGAAQYLTRKEEYKNVPRVN